MSTPWQMNSQRTGRKSTVNRTTDLLEIGFRGLSDTLNIVNELVSSTLKQGQGTNKCNCGCGCHSDPLECCNCGGLNASVDIELHARPGERRIVSFLIENNKSSPQEIVLDVPIVIDGCGERLEHSRNFILYPQKFVIPPCHCQRVKLSIDLVPPFKECTAYYAEIKLSGNCVDEKICLGIYVQPDDYVDHFILTDSCRPKKGEFIEFASCGHSDCQCGDCSGECCTTTKTYYLCGQTDANFENVSR